MIKKTDIVDIISISTPCDLEENEKIKNYLRKIDLEPRIYLEKETSVTNIPTNEFATIPAETRFEQFKKAVESDSKIIWCNRGGYGSAEILPFLMKMEKPKNSKIFIGFSDLSTIGIFLIQQWGWQVISAPMLLQLALNKVSEKSEKATLDLISGKTKELKYQLKSLKKPTATKPIKGIIIGGCLSVIAGNFGTKNQIDWNDKILFLEDEGEDGERLDRYFYQILTIINETNSKPLAIVLGNFLQANPHGTPKAENIEIAIKRFSDKLDNIPLFQEETQCLGHSIDMLPLALGVNAKINSKGELTQEFS